MANNIKVFPTSHLGSLELTEEIIRMRAYQLFEQRGYQHGSDLDDWLEAEAQIMGKRPTVSADQAERAQRAAAA
jgi:Protein of unknown function (DUF2934)